MKQERLRYEKALEERAKLDAPPCSGLSVSSVSGLLEGEAKVEESSTLKDSCPAWKEYAGDERIEKIKTEYARLEQRLRDNEEAIEKMKSDSYKLEETKAAAELLTEKYCDEAAVLRKAEADVREAQAVELSLQGSRKELERLSERQLEIAAEISEKEEQAAGIAKKLEGFTELRDGVVLRKGEIEADRKALQEQTAAIAELVKNKELVDELSKRLAETKEREAVLAKDITEHGQASAGWSLLERAFHSTGIPFLLMERTIPALEKTANELLSGTDLSLIFETEKTNKDGKAKDEINVRYRDERGEFPLKSASGAQRAILSFAARFALAKVGSEFWSRRPKVFIQDEGWGRFNARRYDTARQLIERVAKVFDRFVYITHVEELADIADVRLRTEIVDGTTRLVQ